MVNIEDLLTVGIDISPYDDAALVVMRQISKEFHVINTLRKEEAIEIYKKLIGSNN